MKTLATLAFCIFCTIISMSQMVLPDKMYTDDDFAPFVYGVASGSPTASKVIIWTHITAMPGAGAVDVNWEVATDLAFQNVVNNGTFSTSSVRDYTVKADVDGLVAYTTYYYRFEYDGNYSRVGRTKTAPAGPHEQLRIAVMSCSSIFSGYFNAYGRIGERDDLDLLVHLGDYIYDFIDNDERIRIPDPELPNPGDLTEYRNQHAYYLTDPDLRSARQHHPMIVIWDNHDIEGNEGNDWNGSIQAFYEWVPVRMVDSQEPQRIFQKYSYGELLDIFMIDTDVYRNDDTIPTGPNSMIGTRQRDWLLNGLSQSTARWKLVGNQKLFSTLSVIGVSIPLSGWDAFSEERELIMDYIGQNSIDNVVFISGDAHMAFLADVTTDPAGNDGIYNPQTGDGAIALEMLGGSISRGNLDEAAGVSGAIADGIEAGALTSNPNYRYVEMTDHGHGLLDFRMDSVIGEFWFSEILQEDSSQTFGGGAVAYSGDNHWQQELRSEPSTLLDTATSVPTTLTATNFEVFVQPNPSDGLFTVRFEGIQPISTILRVVDVSGRLIADERFNIAPSLYQLDLSGKPTGTYILSVVCGQQRLEVPIVVQ